MKKRHKCLAGFMAVAIALCFYPAKVFATGTPRGFTVDFSGCTGSGVAGNSLKIMTNGVSVGMQTTTAFGTSSTTVNFDVAWEFDYSTNHLIIAAGGAGREDARCAANVTVNVTNALTGAAISGATVTIGSTSATSDSSGAAVFSNLSIPSSGAIAATVTASGYTSGGGNISASCTRGTTASVSNSVALVPTVDAGDLSKVRIVLTWGATPADLDSHFTGPQSGSSTRFHVYYGSTNRTGSGTTATATDSSIPAFLDVDDTTGYGPETITITGGSGASAPDGVYRYSVHNYSGSPGINTSGASVSVYQGNTLLNSFTIPTTSTAERYWSVFEMTVANGQLYISPVNAFASSHQAMTTELGVTVHTEDPDIYSNLPAK